MAFKVTHITERDSNLGEILPRYHVAENEIVVCTDRTLVTSSELDSCVGLAIISRPRGHDHNILLTRNVIFAHVNGRGDPKELGDILHDNSLFYPREVYLINTNPDDSCTRNAREVCWAALLNLPSLKEADIELLDFQEIKYVSVTGGVMGTVEFSKERGVRSYINPRGAISQLYRQYAL